MADDEFGADADFLAALAETDVSSIAGPVNSSLSANANANTNKASSAPRPTPQRPLPPHLAQAQPKVTPRIQQPAPQRIPRPGAGGNSSATTTPRIIQPTPQALSGPPGSTANVSSTTTSGTATPTPTRLAARPVSSGSTILVSPRQKGNSVLTQIRSVPWEYSDIVADYQLGVTTCALYLSLKYHRLHPEYIYARFRRLQGRFRLRVLLTLVDIDNHEDALRELSKTSLVNDLTLILCWSTAEAARYLELYKSFEHASNFAAIRGQQAAGYAERLVQFMTVPRAINKTDAVALVGSFGSLRNAVLADAEQLGLVSGWGPKKVQAWRRAVEAPFRVQKNARRPRGAGAAAQKKKAADAAASAAPPQEEIEEEEAATDFDAVFHAQRRDDASNANDTNSADNPSNALPTPQPTLPPAAQTVPTSPATKPARPPEETLSEGVAAALARLRK